MSRPKGRAAKAEWMAYADELEALLAALDAVEVELLKARD